jgi:hypothetical protein
MLAAAPTFYRDVAPILENRCQECHRAGEIGRMPLVTYQDARPWAKAIRDAVRSRKMPPWFADVPADARYKLLNDRRLTDAEIATLAAWADSGAAEGDRREGRSAREWPVGWNLDLGGGGNEGIAGNRTRSSRFRKPSKCRRRARWSINTSWSPRGSKRIDGCGRWRFVRGVEVWCITWSCTFVSRGRRGGRGHHQRETIALPSPTSCKSTRRGPRPKFGRMEWRS